jgi:hypothetical protein
MIVDIPMAFQSFFLQALPAYGEAIVQLKQAGMMFEQKKCRLVEYSPGYS